MTIPEISRILFVGAGQMGCANSLVAAVSGYDVVLHDANADALDAVGAHHDSIGTFLVGSGYCTDADLDEARARVTVAPDLTASLVGVDLVSESIVEDAEIKRQVFARIDRLAGPTTILTTNTSSLLVSELESAVNRGDRFAALHSHLGALLFDIVAGPRTSPETVDVLRRYVESIDGVPLVLRREHGGYVFNALNGPILATALLLLLDGIADIETIDRAWMARRGAPMGPFGLIDLFGIDVVRSAWRHDTDDPHRTALRTRIDPLLTAYIDAGNLGMKSGSGFYEHPDPPFAQSGFLDAGPVDGGLADALVATLLCAAAELAALDVASRDDIDMAWTVATGQVDGPFAIADGLGPGPVGALLDGQVRLGLIGSRDVERVATVLRTS